MNLQQRSRLAVKMLLRSGGELLLLGVDLEDLLYIRTDNRFIDLPEASNEIQIVLELQNHRFDELICIQVRDHLMTLSRHRYGRYVVQKCPKSSSMDILVNELLIGQRLYHLARVPHGFCVVETAIKTTQQKNTALFEQIEGAHESPEGEPVGRVGVQVAQ